MTTWTESGNKALERHLITLRASLVVSGVDPEVVAANLRRHIEAVLTAEGIELVNGSAVERVLSRLQEPSAPPILGKAGVARRQVNWGGSIAPGLFGVILPLATLAIEWATGMCAQLFDPIPTLWHMTAIVTVAVANALALPAALGGSASPVRLRWVAAINAFGMGLAAFFALWFLPFTPFAFVGILLMGIGLLPLAPLASLVVAMSLRRGLRRKAVATGAALPRAWPFFAAGFAVLVALEVPGTMRAWAVDAVVHRTPAVQLKALELLRWTSDGESLLRGCYARDDSERMAVRQFLFGTVSPEEQRQVYYRVTGRSFNSRPAPRRGFNPLNPQTEDTDWVWDESLGADRVGQRLKDLYLTESRLDGTVESAAATGYLEWTLVFRNDHAFQQREARALIQLPEGAVVTRLTLWVDGEEREAAFGSRGEVRQAYQFVVSQRRDPVLVTSKGPGRVLVQCFPLAPKGGEMKVRLGITVPLALDQPGRAQLALPQVIEQNFSAAPGLAHAVWIEADGSLNSASPAYHAEMPRIGKHALHASLTPEQFESPAATITAERDARASAWARDPLDQTRVVIQEIAREAPAAEALTVVIDGSKSLGKTALAFADALDAMPADFRLNVRVASDDVQICPGQTPREVAAWLRTRTFTGGQDAVAALRSAVEHLDARGGTLLWIHGAQPLVWSDAAALEQALARRAGKIRCLALPAIGGPNVLLERLSGSSDWHTLTRLGELNDDMPRVLRRLHAGGFTSFRRSEPSRGFAPASKEASVQLWRLWAVDEVQRLMSGNHPQRAAAVRLAVAAHLVTPVTGAVVLESKWQYAAAGLEPTEPDAGVQGVPDQAATWLLLLVALAGLMAFACCSRRKIPT